jgi:hypothetical protein
MSQQKKSNVGLYAGVALAGGVGYYLYTAGGSPKVAEKQLEGTLQSTCVVKEAC